MRCDANTTVYATSNDNDNDNNDNDNDNNNNNTDMGVYQWDLTAVVHFLSVEEEDTS